MAWLESHQSLGDHPKTKKLCRLLRISKREAVGTLHILWWWALDYAEDGDLSKYELMDIAIGADWDGPDDEFVDALVSAGFLDRNEKGLRIHDWHDYAGKLIERRERNARRMRETRAGYDDAHDEDEQTRAAHVQGTLHARVQLPTEPTNQPNQPDLTNTTGPTEPDQPDKTEPIPPDGELPKPWDVLEALCECVGAEIAVLSKSEQTKQLAVAKRLIENDGLTLFELRALIANLQTWYSSGIDLFVVEKNLTKWRLKGKNGRASPNGNHGLSARAAEDRERLAAGMPVAWGSAQGGVDHL